MSNHIISKAQGSNGSAALGVPLVMDIDGSSRANDVMMQVWGENSPGTTNQLWDFPADPLTPGYFHIKSALDGSHLGAPPNWPTFQYVVADLPSNVEDDRFRWRAVQDPNGSGYCYLQNKELGLMIGTEGGSHDQGSKLVMVNPMAGHDSQMWQAPFPDTIIVPTETDHLNLGSGTGYYGSDGTKCTVAVNVTLKNDGSCHFWGKFANCGDVPIFTAPPQNFAIALVVHDLVQSWYSFTVGGFANDLQNVTWDAPGTSSFVQQNWISIALRYQCTLSFQNDEANSGGDSSAGSANVSDIERLMQAAVQNGQGGNISGWNIPNIIYQEIIAPPPYSNVASGDEPGVSGGSFPNGWQPSGDLRT